jgi:hypothetical protein
MDNNQDPVIEIFSGTPWEAELMKTLLQNAEIESFIKNNVISSYAIEPTFPGGVKVMILSSDYEKAKEILDEFYRNMRNDFKEK